MANAFDQLTKAREGKYALGAFNAANLETLKAITQAAKNTVSPILIEASPGEVQFVGIKQMVALVRVIEEEIQLPIILNLDHGTDPTIIKEAVDQGFDYVHFDAGQIPFDEAINVARELADYAHAKGIPIESEIDHIEGSSADHTKDDITKYQDKTKYTDPEKARNFIEQTGIDVFAGFFGNMHGIYSENKHIDFDVLAKMRELCPNTYFSLHGGSGIFDDDVKRAIKEFGIVKVNVNSEMRIAYKMTLQEVLNSSDEIAGYKIMEKPIEEVRKVVESKIKLFGSAGR